MKNTDNTNNATNTTTTTTTTNATNAINTTNTKKSKFVVIICVLIALAIITTGYFVISGIVKNQPKIQFAFNKAVTVPPPVYPDAEFAVISDLHLYDSALGMGGTAFEAVMMSDRKLLLDSVDLLEYAIDEIIKSEAQFVLISGDLTKDGELACHTLTANKLERLAQAGINTYVIPGNHDVNNPEAESYSGDTATPVPNISADDFARIYADFGYGNALKRDAGSLSYVTEPVDGLWLLALDACRYGENKPGGEEIIGGKINQATADWIAGVLAEAASLGKAVMAMSHHGIVEHWEGQSKLHPDYLVDEYERYGEFLASYDVRIVFTGHYHAQDITRADFGGKYIYDIETGSLITAPCPIRFLSLHGGELTVRSETAVDKLRPGLDFEREATAFVKSTIKKEAFSTLKKYLVSNANADIIADAVGDAFAAHYFGDENPALRPTLDESQLSLWGRIVLGTQKYVMDGLWRDLPPADNNAILPLP